MKKLVLLVLACVLPLAGCANGDDGKQRTLTVLAASSLTGTFTDLAAQFEAEHNDVHVKLVFDSSATLAQMAVEHAPGDVLATADERTMDDAATGGGLRGKPVQFASNVMLLVAPKDNPAKIASFADLDHDGVDFLTCVASAPCGAAANALLAADGITRKPVSEEIDVKAVLGKVLAGEADAGLVYRTDATAVKGKVTAVSVPGAAEHPNTYWVATTAGSKQAGLAGEWSTFLTSAKGRAVLRAAGFETG